MNVHEPAIKKVALLIFLFTSLLLLTAEFSHALKVSFNLQISGPGREKGQLQGPTGITATSDGIIYVVDSDNNRIQSFSQSGEFINSFGSKGDGNGQFSSPYAAAVAGDGRLFVTDTGNHRVQVFDKGGNFLYTFGKKGSSYGEMSYPKGIAVDKQERVFVVDSGNRRIDVFTVDGIYLDSFGEKGSENGQFYDSAGIAVSEDGLLWVTDSGNDRIQVFDAKGVFYSSIESKGKDNKFRNPTGIAVDPYGRVIVIDNGNGRIQIFDIKGKLIGSIGSKGDGRAQFSDPQSVYIDENGSCYIADTGNNRVQVFSIEKEGGQRIPPAPLVGRISLAAILPVKASDAAVDSSGNLYLLDRQEAKITILDKAYKTVGSFGKPGSDKGMFSGPSSIVIGDNDQIFVSDSGNHRIQVFDRNGKYLYEFGGKGSTDGKLYSPGGIVYKSGKLWIADTGNNRIQVFNPDGIFLSKFGKKGSYPGELNQPMDVTLDSAANVYVADHGNNWVQVFSPEGKPFRVIGKEGSGKGEFIGPKSVVVDDDDRLFVLESEKGMFGAGNNRIQAFDRKGKFLFRFASYGNGRGDIAAAESISYANRDDLNLFVSDSGNSRLYVLALKEVPSALDRLRLESNEEAARLSWNRSQESFVKGYRIYASRDTSAAYHLIGDTPAQENSFEFRHKIESPDYYFGVTAIAKGGAEGPMASLPDFFKMAYDRYLAKSYKEAISTFSEALKQDPSNERARYYMGLSYLTVGGSEATEKAREIFSRLSYLDEYEEASRLNLGKIALMQRKYSAAETELNRVLAINPRNREVYYILGKAYFERGLYQKSMENLRKSAELEPGNPMVLEMLGLIYHRLKAYEMAISSFEKGLAADKDNPVFHKGLGETYLAVRDLKRAREEFRLFLEKVPDDSEVRLRLAETAIELKEGQEAFDHADIVLAKDKDNPDVHVIKGKALLLLGKKEDALLAFERSVELEPKNEGGRFMLAFIYRELGLDNEATDSLKKLLVLNKNHEAGRILLAEMLAARGSRDMAIIEYKTVQKINPKNSSIYFPLGKLLMDNKDYEGARKYLEIAVKYDPGSIEAHLLFGSVLKTLGRSGEAINAFQTVLGINKDAFPAHYELGKIYLDNNMAARAIEEFNIAIMLEQQNAAAYNLLGKALLKKLKFDEAITQFSTAVKLDPQEAFKKDLNDAFETKKKLLQAKLNVPAIEVQDATIQKVFGSLYKYYNDHPIGELKITNNSDEPFPSLKVSLRVMNYMDFPSDKEVKELKPGTIETIPLNAQFNNKILEIVEDTPAQAEVEFIYYKEKKEERSKLSIPFTIYNRNAITWSDPAMAGAFVTPKDEPVKEFARGLAQQYPDISAQMNKQISVAMLLFDALGAYGVVYSPDPNNPFEKASLGGSIDSVQYPRETLKLKTGDCDDLSTMLAALLENMGIETAFIGTPGHLFIMFKLEIDPKKVDTISLNPEQYVNLDGHIWIPVETTAVGASFNEAWYKGGELYHRWKKENKVEITKVHDAWGKYQPVTLPPSGWSPDLPAKGKIDAIMSTEVNLQKTRRISGLIKPLLERLDKNPKDINARMQLGLAYSENDLVIEAMREFNEIIVTVPDSADAYVNLGNVYLLAGKADNALEAYRKGEELAPKDAEIKVNLAIVYYKKGMVKEAQKKFDEAVAMRPGIKDERSFLYSLLSR